MEKVCYINQPYGLGDILICEPIARHYFNLGYKINYWVLDKYLWISKYIDYINFISVNDNYINSDEVIIQENYIYLPLIFKRISSIEEWKRVGWLYDKYVISNLSPKLWIDFDFKRNAEKEESLFNSLNLKNKDYILLNCFSSEGYRDLKINSNYEIINMFNIEGYTMLDWMGVMEKAKEVHTVSTSVVFPLLKMNHPNIKVYNRVHKHDDTLQSIKYVFRYSNLKFE